MVSNILFVCTANICRSPMAAALLASRSGRAHRAIESAGVAALTGEPADPAVCDLLAEQGIDISGHRSRQVDPSLAREFDLILAMEANQVEWIRQTSPQLWGRTYRLAHWSGEDIPDPYGKPRQHLEGACSRILSSLDEWEQKGLFG